MGLNQTGTEEFTGTGIPTKYGTGIPTKYGKVITGVDRIEGQLQYIANTLMRISDTLERIEKNTRKK